MCHVGYVAEECIAEKEHACPVRALPLPAFSLRPAEADSSDLHRMTPQSLGKCCDSLKNAALCHHVSPEIAWAGNNIFLGTGITALPEFIIACTVASRYDFEQSTRRSYSNKPRSSRQCRSMDPDVHVSLIHKLSFDLQHRFERQSWQG